MKVGVWLKSDYSPTIGGGYSYYDKLVKAIDGYVFDSSLDVCFVTDGAMDTLMFQREVIRLTWDDSVSLLDRIRVHLPVVGKENMQELDSRLTEKKHLTYREVLRKHGVHVLYYLNQHEYRVHDFPFVATNWDIGHSSTFAFPEMVQHGEFERRHHYYSHVLPRALFVFAESEAGKKELITYTKIAEWKIKVVPIFAGNSVSHQLLASEQEDILKLYGLTSNKYFFYPAQFWAHKNHYNLLKAFAQFVSSHSDYKLVLTGADYGNLAYIQETVNELGLKDHVVFPGFVPLDHISVFYRNATALVMASYFGPTNMPPIEAMECGCPVICSNLSGHREILSDAALYFEPGDCASISQSMDQMVNERANYVSRIQHRNQESPFKVETALQCIDRYLQELIPIRSTWL